MPTVITSSSQLSSIINSHSVVVIDFHATWCGPCKMIAPVYESLASTHEKRNQIAFTKVDTDQCSDVARSYNVTAMPTFVFLHNGAEVGRIRGADKSKLQSECQRVAAMAGPAKPVFSGSGRKLGGEDSGSSKSEGKKPVIPKPRYVHNGKVVDKLPLSVAAWKVLKGLGFLAILYFVTLFSFDPKAVAEKWLGSR